MSELKIGDRVKIINKSVVGYGDLGSSAVHKRCINGEGWITEVNPEGPETYTVNDTKANLGADHKGDYFTRSDLQLITKGGAPMARRTFKLTRELPELTKGALLQEKCDDGDQDYTVLDQSFIKYEDEHGRRSVTYARKAVEDEPTWFTEVFKVSPEYMTQDELDQFEVFKVKRTTVKKPKSAAESGKPAKTVILVSKRRRTRGYTLDAFVRIYNSSRNRRSVSAKTGMSVASVYARASQARKAGYPLKAMKRDKEQS